MHMRSSLIRYWKSFVSNTIMISCNQINFENMIYRKDTTYSNTQKEFRTLLPTFYLNTCIVLYIINTMFFSTTRVTCCQGNSTVISDVFLIFRYILLYISLCIILHMITHDRVQFVQSHEYYESLVIYTTKTNITMITPKSRNKIRQGKSHKRKTSHELNKKKSSTPLVAFGVVE